MAIITDKSYNSTLYIYKASQSNVLLTKKFFHFLFGSKSKYITVSLQKYYKVMPKLELLLASCMIDSGHRFLKAATI